MLQEGLNGFLGSSRSAPLPRKLLLNVDISYEDLDIYDFEGEPPVVGCCPEWVESVIFLDIDGVLWPERKPVYPHPSEDELRELADSLMSSRGIDLSKYSWYAQSNVIYAALGWQKEPLSELRRILEATDARIVVSSSWREWRMNRIIGLFRIHGLDGYVIDGTPDVNSYAGPRYKKELGLERSPMRSVEILWYLRQNPHIKRWVAIDDWRLLFGELGEHFINTWDEDILTPLKADRAISVLSGIPTFDKPVLYEGARPLLRKLFGLIKEELPDAAIWLFGDYARGAIHPWSGLCLCVVTSDAAGGDTDPWYSLLKIISSNTDTSFDVMALGPDEFERYSKMEWMPHGKIAKEGLLLDDSTL